MSNSKLSIQKTFERLNFCFFLVLLAYMFDVIYAREFVRNLGFIAVVIFLPAKIFLYAAFCGIMCDVSQIRIVAIGFKDFKENGARYWKIYTILLIAPAVIHFIAMVLFPVVQSLSFFHLSNHLGIVVYGLLAFFMIRNKFLRPLNIPPKMIKVSVWEGLFIFGLFLMDMVLFYAPQFIVFSDFELPRITTFIAKYIQFFLFMYFVEIILRQYPEIKQKDAHEKEIYLVCPQGGGIINGMSSLIWRGNPPVFTVLKAFSPSSYHFKEFNRIPFRSDFYEEGKLVAITAFTSNSYRAYTIAKEFKKRGSTVIMGGPHVSFLPEEALQYCDSVVLSEAENIWREVLNDYENNALKKIYQGIPQDDFYTQTHQQLLKSPPSVIKEFMETTRGCKYRCDFCAVAGMSHGRVRRKPIPQVIELLKKVKGNYKMISFIDNNMYADPAYTRELFKAMKPLKVSWTCSASIDIAQNDETLQMMKDAGCTQCLVGYEIFGGSAEKKQGGKFALAERYAGLTRKLKRKGILIKAQFIYGFDSDNVRSLLELWYFCFRLWPTLSVVTLLTPFPGSRLYANILKQDRLINMNWQRYNLFTLVTEHPWPKALLCKSIIFIMPLYFATTSMVGLLILLIVIVYV